MSSSMLELGQIDECRGRGLSSIMHPTAYPSSIGSYRKRSFSMEVIESVRRLSLSLPAWKTRTVAREEDATDKQLDSAEDGLKQKEKICDDRKDSNKTSNNEALIHLLKGNIGPGMLAIPAAFKKSGLIVGTVGIIVIGMLCIHCMHLLLRCTLQIMKRDGCELLTYADVTERAFRMGPSPFRRFSSWAKFTVKLFLCITQLGFCSVYFVFIGSSIKQVTECYTSTEVDLHWYVAILLPLTILFCYIDNLKALAPVSLFANLLQLSGLFIVFYNVFVSIPDVKDRPPAVDISLLPLFFGTALYAFEGIGLVMPIENSMRTPSEFHGLTGVLNTGMTLVAILYCGVGFFGYLKYGDELQGSITLNFSNTAYNSYAKIAFAASMWFTFPIQFYVAYEIIWEYMQPKFTDSRRRNIANYALRTILVILTFIFAEVVPHLDVSIALVGAIGSSTLALLFPPLLEILTFWPDQLGKFRWILFKDIILLLIAVVGFIAGSYVSIKNAIESTERVDVVSTGC